MILISVDIMGGKVVRLTRGDPEKATIYSFDPLSVAKYWLDIGYGLHIVDLDAALGRGNNRGVVKDVLKLSGFKEISGGIRRPEMALKMLDLGADRVVIGTMAFTDRSSLLKLRGQPVAISLDVRNGNMSIYGWQKGTGVSLGQALNEFINEGFNSFEITFVDRDGTRQGFDADLVNLVPEKIRSNVIISGGLRLEDIERINRVGFGGCIIGSDAYERMYKKAEQGV